MTSEKHVLFIDENDGNTNARKVSIYNKNYIIRNVDVENDSMYDDNNIIVQVDEDGDLKIRDTEDDSFIYISGEFLGEFSHAVAIAIEARNKMVDVSLYDTPKTDAELILEATERTKDIKMGTV